MKPFFPIAIPILAMLAAPPLHGASVVITKPVNTTVPDNSPIGLVSVIPVSSNEQVVSVELHLHITGGWNGDLYAYLEHNGVISVLLNRPGRTADNLAGAASSGMSVTFSDDAQFDDIHTAISNTLGESVTGFFQPDGRAADPDTVTDLSPRSLFLSGFQGLDADGDWTLFIADLGAGDESFLVDWTLTLTTVPEPGGVLLTMIGGTALLLVRTRRKR